jgi:ABC-type uncharacterized transport system auxiliary subunit
MKSIIFYSLVLLFVSGCSLQTKVAAHTQYRLQVSPQTQSFSASTCKENVLQLKNIISYDPIATRSIYYQVGDLKLASYSESNWESPLFKTVESSLISNMRDAKIFKDVISSHSSAKPDFILEYSVTEFIQHFSEDMNRSYATVKIHFALLENKNSKLLYSTDIEKKVPSATLDAEGGVKALQEALGDASKDANIWLNVQCEKGL